MQPITRMNPRGRWRRRRNLRRVPTTSASRRPTLLTALQISSASGPCFGHLPFRIPCKTQFLEAHFREIAFISTPTCSKTGPTKKNYRQTPHRQNPAHLSLAGDPYLNHSKCFLYSGKPPKTDPIPDPNTSPHDPRGVRSDCGRSRALRGAAILDFLANTLDCLAQQWREGL